MAAVDAVQQERAEENDEPTFNDGDTDICQQLMDRYAKSSAVQHRHLIATAAAMRSILAAESLPSTPPAYFAAAISSADSSVSSPTTDPVAVSALLTFLSIVVPLVPSGEISTENAREAMAVLVKLIDREGEKLGVASLRGGVKCFGLMLTGFCDLDDWESLELGFASLLKFSIDKRPKVRRCAQECLEKLLSSFQLPTVIREASDKVYALFEEYKPLLADLSSTKIEEGSKVDLTLKSKNAEAAHVLNVLSVTIPFISSEVCSRAFSELCKLMDSQFSVLTRQVLKAIEAFFVNSKDEVIVSEMENIITSLTGYLSLHDKNPSDTTVHATTLLKCALEKLNSVEHTLCLKKLPLVFASLAGLLVSKEDTASQALVVINDLINFHMDRKHLFAEESLPSEDGDNMDVARSVCAVFESSLNSCDAIPNERILAATANLIEKLGDLSCILTRNILLKLASLMTTTTGDACSSNHIQHCIGSAVVAMGPDKILKLLPISLEDDSHSCTNSWLIPILRKYTIGASLGYYIEHIVPLAKSILQTSKKAKKSVKGKELKACAHGLLELLPAFCNYPVDVATKFKTLAKLLVKFLDKYAFMREAIANSLQILVNQNKSTLGSGIESGEAKACQDEDNTSSVHAERRYTKKASTKNLKALRSFSASLLESFVDVLTDLATEPSSQFKAATGCLASIVDSSERKKLLMSLLEKIDTVNESEIEDQMNQSNESADEEKADNNVPKTQLKRSSVLTIASTFIEGAEEDLVNLIYSLVQQTFEATGEADHHEAYQTLSKILEEHSWFCSSHFSELMEMLLSHKSPEDVESLESRFSCFHVLIVHSLQLAAEEEHEKAFPILNEIILTLKDGNEELRKAACDVLIKVYTSLKSVAGDELCVKLINMITGYTSGSSPHIKSGAVSALSVLVYKDPEISLSSPDFLSSVLSLLHTKAIEVIKAVLGFVKVLVSTLESKELYKLLHDLLWEILPWSSVSRHFFRSKVTIIVEIMIRKCGSRAVQSFTPEKHLTFVQTVSQNRSGKSNLKEETDDSKTTEIVPSERPQKRKYNEASSNTTMKQSDTADHKKSKWQKKSLPHSSVSNDNGNGKESRQTDGKRSFRKYKEGSGRNPEANTTRKNNAMSGKERQERRRPQNKKFKKAH